MAGLPVISGQEAMRAFRRAGWYEDRRKGSHVSMKKDGVPVTLTVPDHKELDPGTLRALIRRAGLTVKEFNDLLK